MAAHAFHQFPKLPKEIRCAIWRQCLPCRVVEIDSPQTMWYFDSERYPVRDPPLEDLGPFPCDMRHTTTANVVPPIISRVCHEARDVALEFGALRDVEKARSGLSQASGALVGVSSYPAMLFFWFDRARDSLHLHWHPWLNGAVYANHYNLLFNYRDGLRAWPTGLETTTPSISLSITDDLLDADGEYARARMRWPSEGYTAFSVCGAVINIHVSDLTAAIRSDLWGLLGEERVKLVDASDIEELARYRRFWEESGDARDIEADVFFNDFVDGLPKIHYKETPHEFSQDLQIRWLYQCLASLPEQDSHLKNEVWARTPEDFDGAEIDPRLIDYGNLRGRPFARQLWEPRRDHPWVQQTLSTMPDFRPTVMFRLCTKGCPARLERICAILRHGAAPEI